MSEGSFSSSLVSSLMGGPCSPTIKNTYWLVLCRLTAISSCTGVWSDEIHCLLELWEAPLRLFLEVRNPWMWSCLTEHLEGKYGRHYSVGTRATDRPAASNSDCQLHMKHVFSRIVLHVPDGTSVTHVVDGGRWWFYWGLNHRHQLLAANTSSSFQHLHQASSHFCKLHVFILVF